ncbi:hypothetical protein [Trichlorobacter sp.]|uniref:hypothetical protein n=1 Tax=Trichlorobacter sp. TaxID=2911007 RepID=UPI002A362368|nr:hypothetical protein [Trichlorobacter sp.]MDY0384546.1 hypothetical protein [Trichlorobacter sp.]
MRRLTIVAVMLLVTGCGSGTQELSSAPQTSVFGKAAKGGMTTGTVFLKDCNNREISTSTTADGSYTLDTTGLTKPYLMKAVFANHSTLYAIVPDNGTAHINESTNWIAQLAAVGLELAEVYLYIKGTLLILLANIAGAISDALPQ